MDSDRQYSLRRSKRHKTASSILTSAKQYTMNNEKFEESTIDVSYLRTIGLDFMQNIHKRYTLYYDETNNIRRLTLTDIRRIAETAKRRVVLLAAPALLVQCAELVGQKRRRVEQLPQDATCMGTSHQGGAPQSESLQQNRKTY